MTKKLINREQLDARVQSLMRYAETIGLLAEAKALSTDLTVPDTTLMIHMKKKDLASVRLRWSVVRKECLELDSQETPR